MSAAILRHSEDENIMPPSPTTADPRRGADQLAPSQPVTRVRGVSPDGVLRSGDAECYPVLSIGRYGQDCVGRRAGQASGVEGGSYQVSVECFPCTLFLRFLVRRWGRRTRINVTLGSVFSLSTRARRSPPCFHVNPAADPP
jgi:hypothetical protein